MNTRPRIDPLIFFWWAAAVALVAFLAYAASGGQSVSLVWANVPGAMKYHMLTGFAPGDYCITNTVGRQAGPTSSGTVSDLGSGIVYYFAIQAVPIPMPIGTPAPSAYSREIVVKTAPPHVVLTVYESCDAAGPWDHLTNFVFRATTDGRFFRARLDVKDE